VTSPYGYRVHPVTAKYAFHHGVDLRADGDTVFAVAAGTVVQSGDRGNLGRSVKIDHNGWESVYGHLSRAFVVAGDSIIAGVPIAISGSTGRVNAPHLHFAISIDGRSVDPLKFIYQLLIRTEHE